MVFFLLKCLIAPLVYIFIVSVSLQIRKMIKQWSNLNRLRQSWSMKHTESDLSDRGGMAAAVISLLHAHPELEPHLLLHPFLFGQEHRIHRCVSCPLSTLPSHPRHCCSSPPAGKPPNHTEERLHSTKADNLEKWVVLPFNGALAGFEWKSCQCWKNVLLLQHPGCSLNTCKSGGKAWADEASDRQTREKSPVVPVAGPFWDDRRSWLNPASPVLTQLQAHIGAPSTNPSDHHWSHWKLAFSHSTGLLCVHFSKMGHRVMPRWVLLSCL